MPVLTLRIVLDTNQLYTESASDLLSTQVKKLIEENRSHSDIRIEWSIPEIVKWEREYQMNEVARSLRSRVRELKKLEQLVRHKIDDISDEIRSVNDEILSSSVRQAIEKQVSDFGLQVIPLKTNAVAWERVIRDAVFRHPPFELGEKEKGFRDAVIAECIKQVIAESPTSPSECRIVPVIRDGLLTKAVKNSIAVDATNVHVFCNLDDLENLINILVSRVPEKFIAPLREKAERCFFSPDSNEGLMYQGRVRDRINEENTDKLAELPEGATIRENGSWLIDKPSFVGKSGQRIRWRTPIALQANAFTLVPRQPSLADFISGSVQSYYYFETPQPVCTSGPASIGPVYSKVPVATGRSLFHVIWSVSINPNNEELFDAKVDDIQWNQNEWQGGRTHEIRI